MILIEVVELVVDVNRGGDFLLDLERESAGSGVCTAVDIVLSILDLLDLVTHDVENDTQAQEDQTEDGEDDHRGPERRDWSPGRKHLLLETACL